MPPSPQERVYMKEVAMFFVTTTTFQTQFANLVEHGEEAGTKGVHRL